MGNSCCIRLILFHPFGLFLIFDTFPRLQQHWIFLAGGQEIFDFPLRNHRSSQNCFPISHISLFPFDFRPWILAVRLGCTLRWIISWSLTLSICFLKSTIIKTYCSITTLKGHKLTGTNSKISNNRTCVFFTIYRLNNIKLSFFASHMKGSFST